MTCFIRETNILLLKICWGEEMKFKLRIAYIKLYKTPIYDYIRCQATYMFILITLISSL